MPPSKRLDEKLARIHAGRATPRDFIVADAKDGDIAFGLTAPGLRRRGATAAGGKILDNYRRQIREVIAPDIVDLVLLSIGRLATTVKDEPQPVPGRNEGLHR